MRIRLLSSPPGIVVFVFLRKARDHGSIDSMSWSRDTLLILICLFEACGREFCKIEKNSVVLLRQRTDEDAGRSRVVPPLGQVKRESTASQEGMLNSPSR